MVCEPIEVTMQFSAEANTTEPARDESEPLHVVTLAVFTALLIVAIVLLNALSILAIVRSRDLRQQPTSVFLVALALSDLLVSTGAVCLLGEAADDARQHKVCLACACLQTAWVACSYASVLLVAVDQCVALTLPFRYTALLTPLRCVLLVVVSWSLVVAWCLSWLLGYAHIHDVTVEECIGPMAILPPAFDIGAIFGLILAISVINIVLYARVWCIARKQQQRIAHETLCCNRSTCGRRETRNNFQSHNHSLSSSVFHIECRVSPISSSEHRTIKPHGCNSTETGEQPEHHHPASAILTQDTLSQTMHNQGSPNNPSNTSMSRPPSTWSRRECGVSASSRVHASSTQRRGSLRADLRLTKRMLLVMASNLLLALPYFLTAALTAHAGPDDASWVTPLRKTTIFIIMSNAVVNPLIHTWSNKKYRTALMAAMGRKRADTE
jgi:hypothetical protein